VLLLGDADRVEILVLMDNYADVLVPSVPPVKRYVAELSEQLIAEHGLSLLIKVFRGDRCRTILMDAGLTRVGVPYNAEKLGVNFREVDFFFLSHGHLDHYGALEDVLKKIGKPVTFVAHPDVFLPKYVILPNGNTRGPMILDPEKLKSLGAKLMITKSPVQLAPGTTTTGEVERTTDFEKGFPVMYTIKDDKLVRDEILDDQSLVIRLRKEGLVVISGCAHAGIINTILHAQKITGTKKVYAVIGGFHLSGAPDTTINKTIEMFREIDPTYIIPMHCTGFKAISRISTELREKFVLSTVGMRVILPSPT